MGAGSLRGLAGKAAGSEHRPHLRCEPDVPTPPPPSTLRRFARGGRGRKLFPVGGRGNPAGTCGARAEPRRMGGTVRLAACVAGWPARDRPMRPLPQAPRPGPGHSPAAGSAPDELEEDCDGGGNAGTQRTRRGRQSVDSQWRRGRQILVLNIIASGVRRESGPGPNPSFQMPQDIEKLPGQNVTALGAWRRRDRRVGGPDTARPGEVLARAGSCSG